MTNTFESIGTEAVNEILSWVKSAKDMIQEQAPLLVQEALGYELLTSWLWFSVGVIFLIVGFIACIISYRNHSDEAFGAFAVGCLALLGGILTIGQQISNIMKVELAPRVYIIEYLKGLTS